MFGLWNRLPERAQNLLSFVSLAAILATAAGVFLTPVAQGVERAADRYLFNVAVGRCLDVIDDVPVLTPLKPNRRQAANGCASSLRTKRSCAALHRDLLNPGAVSPLTVRLCQIGADTVSGNNYPTTAAA